MRIKEKFNAMKNLFSGKGKRVNTNKAKALPEMKSIGQMMSFLNMPNIKFFKTITKKVSGRKIRSRKEFSQRTNKAGSKLSRRLYKSQMREQRRKNSLKRNAGKATKPGFLQDGTPVNGAF